MADRRAIEPESLSTPDRPWSHGVLAEGRPLHVSGQTAIDADDTVLYPGDLERQFERVLENLERVLEAAGGTLGEIADITIYVTDVETWRAEDVGEIRYDYLEAPYPCSTLVEVNALARPGLCVEAEATAYLGE